MITSINRMSELVFERIARATNSRESTANFFNDLFHGAMLFVREPFRSQRSPHPWCEVKHSLDSCNLPNHKYCGTVCRGALELSTKCPPGYQPSHSWGYRVTGCWCDTFQGRNIVCCDCTPVTNSPYYRSSADCGCMHIL